MRLRHGAGIGLVVVLASLGAAAHAGVIGPQPVPTVAIAIHYSRFSPSAVTVKEGSTVRFVITNTDPIDHEFIVGNEALQQAEEAGTDTVHDGSVPGEVSVPAGTTRSTTVSFPSNPITWVFACHLPGHYAYGMRGLIAITS
ncbi:MAG TPA: plastocyanin/azurin family copper-binding protein [Actinomycetota bacterium]|nr:plastocyanin/azurin family copper-binding protein [Actinomycetota bacterium]